MYFSKEIIKKDIPLLLQSYFRGKYFDSCGSLHLGAETRLSLRQHRWNTEIYQGLPPSAYILQVVDYGSVNINIFYATVRRITSMWEMVLLFKNGNDHAKTYLTNKLEWSMLW